MARIRTTRGFSVTRISIAGRLGANDMGRLERACAEALTTEPLRLDIDLRHVTVLDRTAAAVLERLKGRGAVIRKGTRKAPSRAAATSGHSRPRPALDRNG